MSITPTQFCTTLDATSTDVTGTLNKFMKKKIQLQRLSQLLYTAGLQAPLPNVTSLLPLSLINFNFYNQLKYACPALGLTDMSSSSLADLQNMVRSSYEALAEGLNGHPFKQMSGIQDQLNDILGAVNSILAQTDEMNMFACLQSACQGYSRLGVYSDTFQQTTLDSFQKMYTELGPNYGRVLNDTQQSAVNQVDETQSTITGLLSL